MDDGFPSKLAAGVGVKMASAFDRVKGIVVEQLNVAPDEVTAEASFIEDLGADSLDVVELVMALEEEFGVSIADEDAEKIVTVGDAVKYIEAHAGDGTGG